MVNLKEKIKTLIENERNKGHFWVLDPEKNSDLIQTILESYEESNDLKQDFSDLPKKAELIFVAAPTGAGKDSLVARFCYQNPEKNYIELNMDIFRHYFIQFIDDKTELTDKNFAEMTNEFSYEIYSTIQEILLTEFPGTNIIITGTLRETDWVEDTFKRFKEDKLTDYSVKLATLAVPKKESAISVINRYVGIVDLNNNVENELIRYPGTARYTSMKYHDETYEKFPKNLEYFQNKFMEEPGKLIDVIEVYKRGKEYNKFDEDTLVYSSENKEDLRNALEVVKELRNKPYKIKSSEIESLIHKIIINKDYLKSQNTLKEVIRDLAILLEYPDAIKKLDEIQNKKDEMIAK